MMILRVGAIAVDLAISGTGFILSPCAILQLQRNLGDIKQFPKFHHHCIFSLYHFHTFLYTP